MSVAFSILSLCLAGFLFIRVQAVEGQLKQLESRFQESEQEKHELEQSLLAFADEMKSGNERVLKQVSVSQQPKEDQPVNDISQGMNEKEEETIFMPPLPEEQYEAVTYEPSPHSRILQLHKQGHSAVEIAKQLNMGKGEVELIIKFSPEAK